MHAHSIAVQTHGRYLIDPVGDAAGLLLGFHGYAHNAEIMMNELRRIPGVSRWTVVSIQGLHRFYNRDNEVVASWMTRQDRDAAIQDNLHYVDAVVDSVVAGHGVPRHLVCVGFSQGVAMAYRAAAGIRHNVDAVIALAGDVPPELRDGATRRPRVLIGRGTRDKWYTEEKMREDARVFERLGVPLRSVVFDGGHEWSPAFLDAAADLLHEIDEGSR